MKASGKPNHFTTKFDTVVIMGDGFKMNLFEEAAHLSPGLAAKVIASEYSDPSTNATTFAATPGPAQPPTITPHPNQHRSVHHTQMAVMKRPRDKTTGYPLSNM